MLYLGICELSLYSERSGCVGRVVVGICYGGHWIVVLRKGGGSWTCFAITLFMSVA